MHDSMSQDRPKATTFIDFNFHAGSNYYPGGELADELDNGYEALDLRFGWQAYDYDSWSAIFNYANYGVGYWASNVGDSNILGQPMAFYGFINFPLYRSNNLELLMGPALGFAFNIKPYDKEENPQNDLSGGSIAAFFNPSISAAYKVSNSLDLRLGFNFIHMSNGGIKAPNTGFDQYGGNIGLRYHINRKKYFVNSSYLDSYADKRSKRQNSSSSINLFQAFGVDQHQEGAGNFNEAFVSTTTLEYQYRFNEVHGMTAGLNLFYDESAPYALAYDDYETKLFPGAHIGYDFHFWNMAIRQQFGYLLTEAGREIKAGFFMRLALTVDLTNTLYFQAAVKSIHGFKADWADFGFGVRLFKRQIH